MSLYIDRARKMVKKLAEKDVEYVTALELMLVSSKRFDRMEKDINEMSKKQLIKKYGFK